MPKKSPVWIMANTLTEGRMVEILEGYRAEGHGFDAISRRLFAEYGIEVTRQTVAKWCAEKLGEAA